MSTKIRWDWPKQTEFRSETTRGDCFRCCVAAVLQIPAEKVPHFAAGNHCDADAQKWLNERGYVMINVSGGGHRPPIHFPRWARTVDEKADDRAVFPLICCGPTVRTKKPGQHHAVVFVGDEMVYDPHPDNAGLIWIAEAYAVIPFHEPAPTLYGELLVRE